MSRHFSEIIVFPSSLQVDCSGVPARFYCRNIHESRESAPRASFCDDMAFYLADTIRPANPIQKEGHFFRTDCESGSRFDIPVDNRDLSIEGSHFNDPGGFFAAIEPFEIVNTDRLHVAIAAALLGRQVHLYPGAYFKNRAVFRSTLEENYPNVRFHEEPFCALTCTRYAV